MCSEMLNHGLNYGLFLSPFQIDQIHDKNLGFYRNSLLNAFRRKKEVSIPFQILGSYILLEIRAILPETSPFLSGQMAVLSTFFKCLQCLGCIPLMRSVDSKSICPLFISFKNSQKKTCNMNSSLNNDYLPKGHFTFKRINDSSNLSETKIRSI